MPQYGHIYVILCILLVHSSVVHCQIYHITPSPNDPCPSQPCITLSQFAADSRSGSYLYLHQKTVLIFIPGNHSLDSELLITNILSISFNCTCTNPSGSRAKVSVTCAPSTRLVFNAVDSVSISGLEFIGCGGNKASSVGLITIEYSRFQGVQNSSTALELDGSNAIVVRCLFDLNEVGSLKTTLYWSRMIVLQNQTEKAGGALIVTNSSNVVIVDSTFEGNGAEVGGVIFGEVDSNITIINSTFVGNHALSLSDEVDSYGGVLHCQSGCTAVVLNSTFSNNTSDTHGGVVSVIEHSEGGGHRKTSTVIISGSTFCNNGADHRGGAVAVFEGTQVNITGSGFTTNTALHGGAIYALFGALVNIAMSEFTNNEAEFGGAIGLVFGTIVVISGSEIRNGKARFGGAIAAWLTQSVDIQDNRFCGNEADIGAAVYVSTTSIMKVSGSEFCENNAEIGTVYISESNATFYESTLLGGRGSSLFLFNSNLILANTRFINNSNGTMKYQEGGATTAFQSNIEFHGMVRMTDNKAENGGGIHAIWSKILVYGELSVASNMATDSGGGMYLHQSELNCKEESTLKLSQNNATKRGGGIYAASSLIKLSVASYTGRSSVHFIRNSARRGGGTYLDLNSKVYILKLTQPSGMPSLIFTGNSADHGGAVYVADDTNSGTCHSISYASYSSTTECFVQTLALYDLVFTPKIDLVSVKFSEDRAHISGSAVFGGLLDRCTVSPFAEVLKTQNTSYLTQIRLNLISGVAYLTKISTITDLDSISSDPVKVCFCREGHPDCSFKPPTIQVMKGYTFKVSLVAVDQVNHTVRATIHSSLSSNHGGLGEDQLRQTITATERCADLDFNVFSPNASETLILYSEGPCKDSVLSRNEVNIEFLPCSCPIGFQPNTTENTKCVCECDSNINPPITECHPENRTVVREGNFWITYINDTSESLSDYRYLVYPNCPLNYCHPPNTKVYIDLNNKHGSDKQCNFNRSGTLCGRCQPGLSLSLGSSRCIQCSTNWIAMLVVIIIAALLVGVVMVAFLLVLNLTVATGTINGIIFYANIVSANSSTFLPFSRPNFITVFIAWLNLELGIDACLFEGMDTYWKTVLQLAFPAYVIFLVVMVILISEHCTKFAWLIGRKNPVATLDTLILLSYTKLLSIIIATFSFAILKYPDGSHDIVWLPDATVGYLRGRHIALFIVAVAILVAGVAYTALIFSWQWLLYYQHKKLFKWVRYRFTLFLEPYHAPYSFKHRYWAGLLLLVRAVLYVAVAMNVSGDPGVNLLVIGIVIISLLVMKEKIETKYGSIYRKWPIDVLDTTCFVNIIFLCVACFYTLNSKQDQAVVAYISGTITLILFLIVLVYHMLTEVCFKTKVWKKLKQRYAGLQSDEDGVSLTDYPHSDQRDPPPPSVSWIEAPLHEEQPLSALVETSEIHDHSETSGNDSQIKHNFQYSGSPTEDSTAPLLGEDVMYEKQ